MRDCIADIGCLLRDYGRFCEIAETLVWVEAAERHDFWWKRPPLGLCLDLLEFPDGYLETHLVEGYVQAVLSAMAVSEEWEVDFWKISPEERRVCLTQGRKMYEEYALLRQVRMLQRDWAYLKKEILFHAAEELPEERLRCYLEGFEEAEVLELGGDYNSDYVYLAIRENLLLLVFCGWWD